MSKKYWKGFEELNNDAEFKKQTKNEFREELPLIETFKKSAKIKSGRRDFLKTLGFSLTAATVAASCEIPVRKAIPYVIKPEEVMPSIANYYASTFINGSDFCNVLVKTREGRPIKIEGNKEAALTQGGTSVRAQASVVSLYDNARLKFPYINGEKSSWEQVDNAVGNALRNNGGDVVFLTSSVSSPTTKNLLQRLQNRYSNTKVVTYEPISKTGILLANEQSFGQKVVPSYHFDKAEVIVGVDCDFLGTWVSPVEFAKGYIKNRKVDAKNPVMSQHFQFEPVVTITGAKADYRRSVKPSQVGAVLVELYRALGGSTGGSGVSFPEAVQSTIQKAAIALKGARGRGLLVCGSNDVDAQILTNAINNLIGSYGSTIDISKPYNVHQGDDKAMAALVSSMNSGRVGTLIINNVNPAYDYQDAAAFVSGLQKVKTSISLNDRKDETAANVNILAPDHHYLESWNDAEIKKGYFSLIQPTISPLFNTRSLGQSLMNWSGVNGDYYSFLKNNWKNNIIGGGDKAWNKVVHDGVLEVPNRGSEEPMNSGAFSGNGSGAAAKLAQKAGSASGIELALYESIPMGDGRYANNPYLHETPDPISRVCWENVAIVSIAMAERNGWTDGALMRTPTQDSDVLEIKVNGKAVTLPIIIQPGLQDDVIAIALGYGRNKELEGMNEKCATGANVYPFTSFDGQSRSYSTTSGVNVNKVSSGYKVAQTQTHHTIDDDREIINETTLADYKKNKWSGNYTGQKYHDNGWVDHHFVSLYPQHNDKIKQGHHWGMAVDLSTCIGCAACVVSCNIENNVPIVGQEDVHRAHDMHWMRIDRYYATNPETDPNGEHPEVAFQPMMCQHCDNAPCENVCPVNASNHSSEGLNQMAYNRCIGTRYCANNCPFKVRRFNWFDYQGADSFYQSTIFDNDEHVMIDNLTRMVLNPDVTVRSRGVMEKCSFCVQNLQAAKLEAKKEGRKLRDGDAITACQSACPTNAISFGDMNDPESQVSKLKKDERAYELLKDIHVLSSVSYLTSIRNKEQLDGKLHQKVHHPKEHGHGGHHDDHGDGHGGHDNHGKGGHGKGKHDGHDHGDHGHGDHKH